MKNIVIFICSFLLIQALFSCETNTDNWPVLKGPYLGQEPPGMTPEIFAPGIVSTPNYTEVLDTDISNKWRIHFYRDLPERTLELTTELKNGKWTPPSHAVYFTGPNCPDLSLIPDEKMIAIAANRSIDGDGISPNGFDIWVARETRDGGQQVRWLGPEVNSKRHDSWPSMTKNGTLYFYSDREGGMGSSDIYVTKLKNGKYSKAENIGPPVNTKYAESDPYVSLDGSFIVFCSGSPLRKRFGKGDLFVTFKQPDDSWSEPINMGSDINTAESETRPSLTRDGKYMFFSRKVKGKLNIYWVNLEIIKDLKLKVLKKGD